MSALPSLPAETDAPPFAFSVVRLDSNRASLSASGELDLAAVEDFAAMLSAHHAAGRTFIRLDLSGVTFIDCSCLGVLVTVHHRLRHDHGQLILTSASPAVMSLLKATDLEGTLLALGSERASAVAFPAPRSAPPEQSPAPGGGSG